jgi:hypothetical protein
MDRKEAHILDTRTAIKLLEGGKYRMLPFVVIRDETGGEKLSLMFSGRWQFFELALDAMIREVEFLDCAIDERVRILMDARIRCAEIINQKIGACVSREVPVSGLAGTSLDNELSDGEI